MSREERLLAVLWQIRTEAANATIGDPLRALPNRIVGLVEDALGPDRQRAKELATHTYTRSSTTQ